MTTYSEGSGYSPNLAIACRRTRPCHDGALDIEHVLTSLLRFTTKLTPIARSAGGAVLERFRSRVGLLLQPPMRH
jgi:hypothetical protein